MFSGLNQNSFPKLLLRGWSLLKGAVNNSHIGVDFPKSQPHLHSEKGTKQHRTNTPDGKDDPSGVRRSRFSLLLPQWDRASITMVSHQNERIILLWPLGLLGHPSYPRKGQFRKLNQQKAATEKATSCTMKPSFGLPSPPGSCLHTKAQEDTVPTHLQLHEIHQLSETHS